MNVTDFLFDSVYQVVTWVFIALSISGIWYFVNKGSGRGILWSLVAIVVAVAIMIGIMADRYFVRSPTKSTEPNSQTPIKARPFLVAERMVLTQFAADKIPAVDVTFRNTGPGIAHRVTTHAVLWSGPVVSVDEPCPDLPARTPIKFLSKSDIATHGIITASARSDKPLTGSQFDAIQNRQFWLYVYVIVEYESEGERYFTEAYGRYDIVFRVFIKCDKHNDAS